MWPVYRVPGEVEHFRTLLILELPWIFIYMLYSLSTACKSTVYVFSWKRPVIVRIRVPRRPVPVWNLPSWAFCTQLPSDCHFLCFQFFQASFKLVPTRSLKFVLYLIGSDLLVEIYRVPRCPEQQKPAKASTSTTEKTQDEYSHMKSLQAQTKNKTQKSLSNHQRHNYF